MPEVAPSADMPLWDDNPSVEDLLGFDAVLEPIRAALAARDVDPLTIGIQSPWGGGKSTLLELLAAGLKDDQQYLVIRTDPWQYDSHEDVRGVLISEVLDAIRTHFDTNADVKRRIGELLGRVSWSRVVAVVGKGLLTMQWKPAELVKAFTPEQRSSPKSMSGFKDAFAQLLKDLPDLERVVVLVDDLDRCLPSAVMATLEAIKLFLAVPKMVFIIAADQDMVRESIAANLAASNRKESFAGRYLEKIVQLPISLPTLAPADAEAYIGLLLTRRETSDGAAITAVAAHAASRRAAGKRPLLSGWDDGQWHPSQDTLTLAAQLAQGLSADKFANPRQIKRFLNAYGVRSAIARAREVQLPAAMLVKMLLLEDQHRAAFQRLAATPVNQRGPLLTQWEAWGRHETDNAPDGIPDTTRDWAGAEPRLADGDIHGYLSLAATLLNVHAGGFVSDEIIALIEGMLAEAESVRDASIADASTIEAAEQLEAVELLFAQGRQLDDPYPMFLAAIRWARSSPAVIDTVAQAIRDNWSRLTPGAVVELSVSGIDKLRSLVPEIHADTSLPPAVIEAARIELEN